jgi:hypothetical protein
MTDNADLSESPMRNADEEDEAPSKSCSSGSNRPIDSEEDDSCQNQSSASAQANLALVKKRSKKLQRL